MCRLTVVEQRRRARFVHGPSRWQRVDDAEVATFGSSGCPCGNREAEATFYEGAGVHRVDIHNRWLCVAVDHWNAITPGITVIGTARRQAKGPRPHSADAVGSNNDLAIPACEGHARRAVAVDREPR